jgi:hypothetical protein
VFMKTHGKVLWFAWFVLSLLPAGPCFGANSVVPPSWMTVSVYNDANVPADAMASAEATAARIFRLAGLEVRWILCTPSADPVPKSAACSEAVFPSHLHVRILLRSRNLTSSTFGVSYLSADGTGCYSDIFFARILNLHSSSGQDIGAILGHVMAHEIAHLLLGMNGHSAFGIMRAQWQKEELLRASKGELLFTEEESQLMRQRLSVAKQAVGD